MTYRPVHCGSELVNKAYFFRSILLFLMLLLLTASQSLSRCEQSCLGRWSYYFLVGISTTKSSLLLCSFQSERSWVGWSRISGTEGVARSLKIDHPSTPIPTWIWYCTQTRPQRPAILSARLTKRNAKDNTQNQDKNSGRLRKT